MRASSVTLLLLAAVACERTPEPAKPSSVPTGTQTASTKPTQSSLAPSASSLAVAASASPIADQRAAAERVVAIGDLHGDLKQTKRALRLAGAIDERDAWVGGKLVLVQTGDEIDRGDDDRKILDLMDRLKGEAKKAGGEVIALVGNHEIMNSMLDLRYVTKGGFSEFDDLPARDAGVPREVSSVGFSQRSRAEAFAPGGRYATMLAARPFMAKVGDSLFVHGGILPAHVRYGLGRMQEELSAWLLGRSPKPPEAVVGDQGPLWTRFYTGDAGNSPEQCETLTSVLDALGAKRLVMGHTPQKNGITNACGGKEWRIDVGMSHFYGGPVQVLEIRGNIVGPLAAP